MNKRRRIPIYCGVLFVALLPAATARGGGLVRTVGVGARAAGLSGAGVPVIDDSTAVFHNPAGLMGLRNGDVLVSLELITMFRKFTPVGWPTEKASMEPQPAPMLSAGVRFKAGANSFMGFGFAAYNAYGGRVWYDQKNLSEGVTDSRLGALELAPAVAYEIDRRVWVGLALRIGVGYFSTKEVCGDEFTCRTGLPPRFDVKIDSMLGVSAAYTLGLRVEPFDGFTVGVVYRSNLAVKVKGDKALHAVGQELDAVIKLRFPQILSFGMAYRFSRKFLLAVQFDWQDNSTFKELLIELQDYDPAQVPVDLVTIPTYWKDSYAVHLGAEIRPTRRYALRGGLTFDSQAVPDRFRGREIEDYDKLSFDVGFSVYLGRWRIEGAFDLTIGPVDNGFRTETFPADYATPGKHHVDGTFSFHVAGGVVF